MLADFGCCLADSDVNLMLPYPSYEMCIGGNTALMAPEVSELKSYIADSDVNLVLPYEMCIGGSTALMAPDVSNQNLLV